MIYLTRAAPCWRAKTRKSIYASYNVATNMHSNTPQSQRFINECRMLTKNPSLQTYGYRATNSTITAEKRERKDELPKYRRKP